ncbi:hypothetical protein ACFT5B_08895, partial [Luteimicrobium sp. NPDC057192]|uniref:hypothetical protein n=1 Tax=Luteimicrobium sp. NPDC057192 TaxID=3346042 RepID=UPI00363A85F4
AFAEGDAGFAEGDAAFAEGDAGFAEGDAAFAGGDAGFAEGDAAFAEGDAGFAEGDAAFAEGDAGFAEGDAAFAGGDAGFAEGDAAFAEGDAGFAEGDAAFAEGDAGFADGDVWAGAPSLRIVWGSSARGSRFRRVACTASRAAPSMRASPCSVGPFSVSAYSLRDSPGVSRKEYALTGEGGRARAWLIACSTGVRAGETTAERVGAGRW